MSGHVSASVLATRKATILRDTTRLFAEVFDAVIQKATEALYVDKDKKIKSHNTHIMQYAGFVPKQTAYGMKEVHVTVIVEMK